MGLSRCPTSNDVAGRVVKAILLANVHKHLHYEVSEVELFKMCYDNLWFISLVIMSGLFLQILFVSQGQTFVMYLHDSLSHKLSQFLVNLQYSCYSYQSSRVRTSECRYLAQL